MAMDKEQSAKGESYGYILSSFVKISNKFKLLDRKYRFLAAAITADPRCFSSNLDFFDQAGYELSFRES